MQSDAEEQRERSETTIPPVHLLVEGLVAAIVGPLRLMGGIAAAMLPSRLWPRLDAWVPASACAAPAAIVTIFAAGAIGFPGFFRHAEAQSSSTTAAAFDAVERQVTGRGPRVPDIAMAAPLAISSLSLFTFLFLTPTGWLTAYLAVSGVVRAASAALDDPFGDPILTGFDAGIRRLTASVRARRARRAREALEGPEVPDRALRGAAAGFVDAELVIVASRPKPDWTPGTVVVSTDAFYRIGAPVERMLPQGLRTLYPLTRYADLQVIRRSVEYDMPRIEDSRLPASDD